MPSRNIAKPILPDNFSQMLSDRLGTEVVREYAFSPFRKWRFDYCIPKAAMAIEIEGGVWTKGRHVSPKGFLGDMEKYNAATSMGWAILRFTVGQQFTEDTFNLIKSTYEARTEQGRED